ncbi:MAG TPA: hypothetical protein VIN72_07080 [Lutibacter sp.]
MGRIFLKTPLLYKVGQKYISTIIIDNENEPYAHGFQVLEYKK